MGKEVVYCAKCGGRLLEDDFKEGHAFPILNRFACDKCLEAVIAALSPEDRELYDRARRTPAPKPETKENRPASSASVKAFKTGNKTSTMKAEPPETSRRPQAKSGTTPPPGPALRRIESITTRKQRTPPKGARHYAAPSSKKASNSILYVLVAVTFLTVIALVLVLVLSKTGGSPKTGLGPAPEQVVRDGPGHR